MGEVDGNGKLTGRIHFIQVSLEGIRGLLNEANMEIVDKGTLARYADRVADLDARLAEANDALRELAKEKATLESMLNDEDRRLERMADTVFSRVKMRRGR
jgi:predicted nuclease with TOPRIM domain